VSPLPAWKNQCREIFNTNKESPLGGLRLAVCLATLFVLLYEAPVALANAVVIAPGNSGTTIEGAMAVVGGTSPFD
jgi:hypothetical protein